MSDFFYILTFPPISQSFTLRGSQIKSAESLATLCAPVCFKNEKITMKSKQAQTTIKYMEVTGPLTPDLF